jgi:CubicO group peptidase (beta-lactamase class C family)
MGKMVAVGESEEHSMRERRGSTCKRVWILALAVACTPWQFAGAADVPREKIGRAIVAAMEKHDVPGASVAVIANYAIAFADGFGQRVAGGDAKVTPETLFQAASISKPVTAAATLKLVDQGKLDLDAKANDLLKSWQIPDDVTTKENPVRVRHLLSHTAGLTVHGFGGYPVSAKRPTLVEILDGKPPANSPPIRSSLKPGYMFRYSGGGYCVLQQLLIDTTETPFPTFMREQVLAPLAMSHSTYEQPLSAMLAENSAKGHREKQVVIPGGYNVYPEMAAAGLWTTPSDLALFAIDVAKSYAGTGGTLLSGETARRMLTAEKASYGLGLSVVGKGRSLRFNHGGSNEGYRCLMIACPMTGQGLVIMTNSDTGSAMFNDLVKLVGELYDWPPP